MPTHAQRLANYQKVSDKLSEIGPEGLSTMLKSAESVHSGIGGTAVKLVIDGVPIFAKKINVSDLDMANRGSTANYYDLPTSYQYGVGSAGFGPWRELEAHKKTSDWVRSGECENFPMMYGSIVLPKEKQEPMPEEQAKYLATHWANNPAIINRFKQIDDATNCVVVLLESIPQNLGQHLNPSAERGEDVTAPRDVAKIAAQIKSTADFMASKGMIHFDAHNGNLLVDEDGNVRFGDLGLATSTNFDLSDEERPFLEQHKGYDHALALAGIGWATKGMKNSLGERVPTPPAIVAAAKPFQGVASKMDEFHYALRADPTKTLRAPMDEFRGLCDAAFTRKLGDEEVKKEESFASRFAPKIRSVSFADMVEGEAGSRSSDGRK